MPVFEQRRPVDLRALVVMSMVCAIWGSQQVAIKLVAADMSPLLQVGVRSGVAALVVSIIVLLRIEQCWFRDGTWKPGLLVGVLFGFEFVFVGEGLRFTTASHMAMFLYTAPIFAALGLHWTKPEERLNRLQWLGVAVAFGGVVLSFAGDGLDGPGGMAWLGDLYAVAGGAAWGATTVAVRGSKLSNAPATVTLLYQLVGAFVLATGMAVLSGQTAVRITPSLLASVGYQAIVIAGFSYLAWFILLQRYLASRLGVLTFMTPIFGVIAGTTLLYEQLDIAFILGALLIFAGISLVSGRDLFSHRRAGCERPSGGGPQPGKATSCEY